jgi:hypothetical protein
MKQMLKAVLVLVGITYIFVLYLSFWPFTVIDVTQPIQIMNRGDIKMGGSIVYKLVYDKKEPFSGEIIRQLVNDYTLIYPPLRSNLPTGKGVLIQELKLPKGLCHTGKYRLRITLIYQPTVMKKVTYSFESEPFEIIGAKNEDI